MTAWSPAGGPAVNGVLSILSRLTSEPPLHHFVLRDEKDFIALLLPKSEVREREGDQARCVKVVNYLESIGLASLSTGSTIS